MNAGWRGEIYQGLLVECDAIVDKDEVIATQPGCHEKQERVFKQILL
jgi:hypothetical protein